jgi:hygromycin-B 4-O-kinase
LKSVKPLLEPEQIQSLLRDFFGEPAQELEPVQGGEVAQTLSFRVGQQEYILRINSGALNASFQKEAFIFRSFASPSIPIPPILEVGYYEDWVYAILPKLPGRGLMALSPQEYAEILPELIRTLYAIHTSDVSRWTGFGLFDDSGQGMAESWRGSLAGLMEEEEPGSFFGNWHTLFTTTFLERDFFDTVYQFMLGRLDQCPEERYLVHGDFGYNNVLAHEGKLTAVLDWINAQYGDFVYDIAWLDFWGRGLDFPGLIRQFYIGQGMALPHYEERIACYQAYIGLNAMRFYAKIQNQEAYGYTRKVLSEVLKGGNARRL